MDGAHACEQVHLHDTTIRSWLSDRPDLLPPCLLICSRSLPAPSESDAVVDCVLT